MIEDNFAEYSSRFKASAARVPSSLAVTQGLPGKVLVVGSCLSVELTRGSGVPADHILFNGGVLGELPDQPSAYDFQIIQIPLRQILTDDSLWHIAYHDIDAFERAFEDCKERLALYFRQFVKFNREHGLLTFVCNFVVPAQNPNGRLLRHYDKRNLQHFIYRLNEALEDLCMANPKCFMLDVDSVASSHGKRYFTDEPLHWFAHGSLMSLTPDADLERRMEPTPHIVEHFELFDQTLFSGAVFAEAVAMYRTYRQTDQVKLIVVDLDDTLWKGVSGDMEIIERTESPFWTSPLVPMSEGWPLGVAEALLYCKKRGILLGIISKNDEARIQKIFADIFDHKLSLSDFSICRINWEPKAKNMKEIIETVNVLPESVVFIDDNPVERASMAAAFPTMRVIGRYFQYTRSILLWSPETQVAQVTNESSRKTEMIQAQVEREAIRRDLSEADFLAALNVSMNVFEIAGVDHPTAPRALELINKTNQWNSTGARLDSTALASCFQQGWRLFGLSVADKFTRYGDVGFILCDGTTVALFVMSCRVIGLQVETRFLQEIMRIIGATELAIAFADTGKNVVIKRYLDARCQRDADGSYTLSGHTLPELTHIDVVLS